MALHLKQSTASQNVLIGPFVDDTDGATVETGLTINASDIRLSKNGANIVAKNSGGGTHDELGMYQITLDATDTDTVGRLQLIVDVTGALPVYHEFEVLEEAIYDALYGASANAFDSNGRVDVASIEGSDATDQINAACDAALSDYDAVVPADLPTNFADLAITAGGAVTVGTNNDKSGYSISGSITTLDGLNNLSAADVNAEADTAISDYFGTNGSSLSAIPWNSAWDAEVQSEVTDALNAYDPPTKAELDTGLAGLNDPTAATIAAAVWDEDATGHQTAGTFGEALGDPAASGNSVRDLIAALNDVSTADVNAEVDTAISDYFGTNGDGLTAIPWNSAWDAEVQSEVTDALNAYDPPTRAELTSDINTVTTDIGNLNDISTADVNAQVLDVLNTDTFGEPSGVPGASETIADKIGYLYMALRNKVTVTASKKTFFDDSDNAEWEKDLSDDGTTYTETEANSV